MIEVNPAKSLHLRLRSCPTILAIAFAVIEVNSAKSLRLRLRSCPTILAIAFAVIEVMSLAKSLHDFSLQNECNRLLQTKTVNELVFELVSERKANRRAIRLLKEKLTRREISGEDHVEWSKNMVKQFQHVLDHERKVMLDEKQGHVEANKMVRKVNVMLEKDNYLLIQRVKKLEIQIVELKSQRLVESVLLEQSVLKKALQQKQRLRQAEEDMRVVALKKAFAFAHRTKKRRNNNKKIPLVLKPI